MTTEAVEQTLEVTDEAQEEAAFNSVFADGEDAQPSPEPETTATETMPEATEQASGEQPPEQKESPVLLAGLTEDQVKDLLLKAGKYDELGSQVQKIFGRLGAFNDTLNTLKQRSSNGVQLSPGKFKRLGQEFPELAEMLSADLSEAIGSNAGGASFDPKQIDDLVSSRLSVKEQEIQRQMEARWLTKQHRDWQGVVASADFNLWKDNILPQQDRQQLENSWDADFISDKLTAFKDWKASQTAKPNTQGNRQKRLESAVLPQGKTSTTTPMDEEDAYLSAWKT